MEVGEMKEEEEMEEEKEKDMGVCRRRWKSGQAGGDRRGGGRDGDGAAEEGTHSAGKSSPSGRSGTAAPYQSAASPQMARLCR